MQFERLSSFVKLYVDGWSRGCNFFKYILISSICICLRSVLEQFIYETFGCEITHFVDQHW